MRILFASDTYYPHLNGVYTFVRQLGTHLQKMGHEVFVVAPSETTQLTRKRIDGLLVYGVPSMPVFFYPIRIPVPFTLYPSIRDIISEVNPDVIHVQSHFFLGKAIVNINKALGIPILGTNHFMPENLTALIGDKRWKERLNPILWSSLRKVFRDFPVITAPSEAAACLIRNRFSGHVKVISNGIDLARFNPEGQKMFFLKHFGLPQRPLLLFVGRVDPEKKLAGVLRAMPAALKEIDFHFVIVGEGVAKAGLKELACKLNIADRVLFTGFVPDKDLPHYYRISTCFIMPSTAELQSIATMEAMASGLPVIAVNACALSELVSTNVNGFLFDDGDETGITASLIHALESPRRLAEMSKQSLEIIKSHDILKSAESFETLYGQVVSQVYERRYGEVEGMVTRAI